MEIETGQLLFGLYTEMSVNAAKKYCLARRHIPDALRHA